jgi:hypothetical protein
MIRFRRSASAPTPDSSLQRPCSTARWVIRGVGTVFFTVAMASKVLAVSMAEYGLFLAILAIVSIADIGPNTNGAKSVLGELQAAAQHASLAHLNGNRTQEIAGLAETMGLTKAMLALTAGCDACGEQTADLQQLLDVATHLKAVAQGGTGTCKPDGVIGRKEACDPLAQPSGCPTTTFDTFCDDACECVSPPSTTPCDFPFPTECDAQCNCTPIP